MSNKDKAAVRSKAEKESRPRAFFRGLKTEFGKIIWPDRYTVGRQLAVVAIVTVITGVIIALVDFGSQNLIDWLITFNT